MGIFSRKKKKSELEILLDGYELPSFSTVVLKVLNMLRDMDCPMNQIATELACDPSLVVSVFRMVNSSAFGLVHKVDSISQAVMLLGRARVESIVLSHAVKKALPKVSQSWFDMKQFWEVSSQRATLARNFAKVLHPETAISSFTAAMLQDIGMPVLISSKGSEYTTIYEKWTKEPCEIFQLEEEAFACDHQKVGRLMGEEWTFPDTLTNAIGNHHNLAGTDPAIFLVSHLDAVNIEESTERIISLCSDNYSLVPEDTQKIIDCAFKEASTISLG